MAEALDGNPQEQQHKHNLIWILENKLMDASTLFKQMQERRLELQAIRYKKKIKNRKNLK